MSDLDDNVDKDKVITTTTVVTDQDDQNAAEDELYELPVKDRTKGWFFLKVSRFALIFTALIIVTTLVDIDVISDSTFKEIFITLVIAYMGSSVYDKFKK